jgi:pyruvate dehydrogenase E2 component (dihydrolipoamide acetyltransferase)
MITKVIMPQVGQDIETGRIVRWLKKAGDQVKKGEALCEVETEKAVVEVPSPADGYLLKILFPENAEVKILSEIGFVGDISDSVVKTKIADSQPNIAKQRSTEPVTTNGQTILASAVTNQVKISPKARNIAQQHGVAIEQIHGTGPQERIVEKDIWDFIDKQKQSSPSMSTTSSVSGGKRTIELNKIRKVTAQRLQQSKQTIPHFYISVSADMSSALKKRKELNDQYKLPKEEAISINDFIVRASALAIKDFPVLNSSFSEEGIILWDDIDVGIAVALDDGLVVPVIENPNKLDLKTLSTKIRQLVQAARSGKQLMTRPGRFTISNLGMYHVDDFAAIINPPEVGILAVSSIQKKLVIEEDNTYVVRDIIKLTLSVDHRVVDGAVAAKFLNRIKELLETAENL